MGLDRERMTRESGDESHSQRTGDYKLENTSCE